MSALAAQRQALREASEAQQTQHAIALEEVGAWVSSQQPIEPSLLAPK